MSAIETGVRLTLKNILLLTDFSEPSELAVPFATAIAREYESKLYAMHVLTPAPIGLRELQSRLQLQSKDWRRARKQACNDSMRS